MLEKCSIQWTTSGSCRNTINSYHAIPVLDYIMLACTCVHCFCFLDKLNEIVEPFKIDLRKIRGENEVLIVKVLDLQNRLQQARTKMNTMRTSYRAALHQIEEGRDQVLFLRYEPFHTRQGDYLVISMRKATHWLLLMEKSSTFHVESKIDLIILSNWASLGSLTFAHRVHWRLIYIRVLLDTMEALLGGLKEVVLGSGSLRE